MNKKLSVLIIGCGRVSAKHIKAINKHKDKLYLVGLVDTNESFAKKTLNDYTDKEYSSKVSIYSDYQKAVLEKKPDIVAITVPSGLHYQIAEFCLNNNCNLLLEKPMAMSSSECKKLYELSEKMHCKIAMGHIYRYFPLVGLLKDDLKNGKFGKILYGTISVRWGHSQDYYNSSAWRGTWKSDGGALMNQSIHAIDLLIWLMSDESVSVQAMLAKRLLEIEAEDLGLAVIKLKSGALASIEGTTATLEDDKQASFNIYCEKGHVALGLNKGKPWLDITNENGKKVNGHYILEQVKKYGVSSILSATNPHTAIYGNLANSIYNNESPIADDISGYTSVDTLLGIYKSARDGKRVNLPLEEDFNSMDMQGFIFDD